MASPESAIPVRSASRATPDTDKTGRRRACNECKQQKLRCNLPSAGDDAPDVVCSRCQRLGLECRVDTGFRRVRKRRRSFELEKEVQALRQQLRERDQMQTPSSALQWNEPPAEDSTFLTPSPPYNSHQLLASPAQTRESIVGGPAIAPQTSALNDASSTAATGPSPDAAGHSRAPGVTTRPGVDDPEPRPRSEIASVPRPRALGNIALSVEEIDELFAIYVTHYHPFLPILDTTKSPHDTYSSSELLFWSIMSVASRRLRSHPTLLPRLARAVTDLVWRSIRATPYSLATVQALALICTWPFPTSSSTADPTFVFAGAMLQLGVQMGLHRAYDVQDFVKVPMHLTANEHAEWIRTWESCNIVAQSVSVGCGLPVMIQMHDWSLTVVPDAMSSSSVDISLRLHLRIEQFRHRVSHALGSNVSDISTASSRERLSLYRLLNASLVELEREILGSSTIMNWYLSAARLHLQAFYLLDDGFSEGYSDRALTLYQTACSIIELCQDINNSGTANVDTFFHFCPFFCYQVFVCAAFVVLKIVTNGFFRTLVDSDAGRRLLDSAIVHLRTISVVNNDLPARLGDVIGFFCTLPDQGAIGGATIGDLKLREVKNRLSMSVVYDSLWIWRKHFRINNNDGNTSRQPLPQDESTVFNSSSLGDANNLST